jgi:hypothetical protein
LLAHGLACGSDDPVFPSQAGTHLSDDNVRARIIRPAVARANLRREREGLPPLPDAITPQSLRRTYISIALMVSGPGARHATVRSARAWASSVAQAAGGVFVEEWSEGLVASDPGSAPVPRLLRAPAISATSRHAPVKGWGCSGAIS